MHDIDRKAVAYAFRFGDTDVWKIGWAIDPSRRLAEVNRHVPVEVLGANWQIAHAAPCGSLLEARAFEQRALSVLGDYRTTGERLRCTADVLARHWRRLRPDRETDTIAVST